MKKYNDFKYRNYSYSYDDKFLNICYEFEIVGLDDFQTSYKIPYKNKYLTKEVDDLIFYLGLIESLSVYKLTVADNYHIDCRKTTVDEFDFFKKIMRLGLGEFFYTNNLKFNEDINFTSSDINKELPSKKYKLEGRIIAVGGGKDSVVSIELLKKEIGTELFLINKLPSAISCIEKSGLNYINIERKIDQKIIKYNKLGFYNGHTPFSAMVAFASSLTALVNGVKDIVLSNESSADESSVKGSDVNHQYSKSYEFENDFRHFIKSKINTDLNYFSFLRPLNELSIAKIFATKKEYHSIFTSCNLKSKEGKWCNNCAKCLFIFIMLAPFLTKEELIVIFGENLLEKESLLMDFEKLYGKSDVKPFECVGTYDEINQALNDIADDYQDSFLMKSYLKDKNKHHIINGYVIKNQANLSDYYFGLLKKEFDYATKLFKK